MAENEIYWGSVASDGRRQIGIKYEVNTILNNKINFKITTYIRTIDDSSFVTPRYLVFYYRLGQGGNQILDKGPLSPSISDTMIEKSIITKYFDLLEDPYKIRFETVALLLNSEDQQENIHSGIPFYEIAPSYNAITIVENLPQDVQNELNSDYPPPENFYKVPQAGTYYIKPGTEYIPPKPSLKYHECTGWKLQIDEEEIDDNIHSVDFIIDTNTTQTHVYTLYPQWERLNTKLIFDYQDFPPLIAGKISLPLDGWTKKGEETYLPQKRLDLNDGIFIYSYDFNFINNNNLLDKNQYTTSHFFYTKYFNYNGWKFKLGNVDNVISVLDYPQCIYPPTDPWIQRRYEELYYPDEQNISLDYTFIYSSKVTITVPTLSENWYRHLGWFDTNNEQNAQKIFSLEGKVLDTTNLTEDITQTVYAGWEPKNYILQFDSNFIEQQGYQPKNIPSSKWVYPTIENKRLWFGNGETFPPPDWTTEIERVENSDPILIQESENIYTIIYHYQDETGAWQSKTEVVQKYAPFKYWTLTREGTGEQYSFGNFTPTSDDIDFGDSGDLFEGTVTLFAQWDLNADSTIDGTILFNPTREGYRLTGWYKDPFLRTVDYKVGNGGKHWDRGESTQSEWHLYAEWEPIPCTITYNNLNIVHHRSWGTNYQIVSEVPYQDPQTKTVSAYFYSDNNLLPEYNIEEKTVVINAPSFKEWITESGVSYQGGINASPIYISDKTPGINIIYDANNKIEALSLTLSPKWEGNSSSYSIKLPKLESEEGRTFLGWIIEESGENKYYEYDTFYNLKELKSRFDAWWKDENVTVTYNTLNYGETPESQSFTPKPGTFIILSDSTFDRIPPTKTDGYNIEFKYDGSLSPSSRTVPFSVITTYGESKDEDHPNQSTGWNTQMDGKGDFYGLGASYSKPVNVTLYPYWIESKSTEFNFNDYIPDYPGHTLKGIYLNNVKIDEDSFLPIEDTTLTVKWDIATYNIEYDANGGRESSLPKPQIKEHDKDIELSVIAPSYMDKVFIGWQYFNIENTGPAAYEGEPTVTFSENNRTYTITWNNNNDTITKNIEIPANYEESDYTIWYYWTSDATHSMTIDKGIWSKDKKKPESQNNLKLWTYVEVTMGSKLYHPGDTYSENHDVTFMAQWREIITLTEWLSNWETTVASTYQDIPGNQLILYNGEDDEADPPSSYKDWSSLFDVLHKTVEEVNQEIHRGYGYKVKLDLVNPYDDMDDNNDITPLQRIIFVPAKMREEDDKKIWYGIYETPSDVKVLDVSLYDGAQADFNYQLHYNLNDLIDTKAAQFYEIIDSNVIGQILGDWSGETDITPLIQNKYYAYDENGDITYENVLDSWSFLSFESLSNSSEEIKVNISTVDNPQLISYFLDEQGLYIDTDEENNPVYLDFSNTLIKQFIIHSGKTINGIINYRATIAQKTYA